MNTSKLIETVAKTNQISKIQAKKVIGTVFSSIQQAVKKGGTVSITKFGTFTRAKRKARLGRNPKTGAQLKIAASRFPKFRPGAAFKAAVR